MRQRRLTFIAVSTVLLFLPLQIRSSGYSDEPTGKEMALKAGDISNKLFPDTVFFRGQVAPTQLRNSGGVKFADGFYVLASLVDSSGYSSGIREKYQAYLLSEVPLDVAGQSLKPGAYGIGFLSGGKFVVMDLGANEVFQVASKRDADLKRPMPLQIITGESGGNYRLYAGREFIEFHRAR